MTDPNPGYAALRSLVTTNQAAVVRALRELGYRVESPTPLGDPPPVKPDTWVPFTSEDAPSGGERSPVGRACLTFESNDSGGWWWVTIDGKPSSCRHSDYAEARAYAERLLRLYQGQEQWLAEHPQPKEASPGG
jgi:hypothetical protein